MSNNAASNVIAMREFDRPAPSQQAAQFERLLKECQDLALERLSQSVARHAGQGRGRALGPRQPDHGPRGARSVHPRQGHRAVAAQAHRVAVPRRSTSTEFDNRARRDKKPKEAFSQFELGSLELGLVNDDDLEETLKLNDMAAKLRRYCEEELGALDQRIGVLVGDANLAGRGQPVQPASHLQRLQADLPRPRAEPQGAHDPAQAVRRPRARRHPPDLQGPQHPAGGALDPAEDPLRRGAPLRWRH